MPSYSIIQSDVLVALKAMPDASFDALLTDPPSGIGFSNEEWDSDKGGRDEWIAWLAEIVVEIARVLRPGAYGLVWALPRTSHWTATALENGGLQIRDRVSHLFGSGVPKPMTTASKMIEAAGGSATDVERFAGYAMAIKPAVEDWWLVRKPMDGTVANTCAKHGTGVLNIAGTRVGLSGGTTKAGQTPDSESRGTYGRGLNGSYAVPIDAGRWPSHLVLDDAAAALLDEQAGDDHPSTLAGRSDPATSHDHTSGAEYSPHGIYGMGLKTPGTRVYADDGGPSRFFKILSESEAGSVFKYAAKPSTAEREFGCEALPLRTGDEMTGRKAGSKGLDSPQAGAGRSSGARNFHKTIKGITLTTYLATLLLPPPRVDGRARRLLCLFSGSGGEVIGGMRAGWDEIVGVERDADFVTISRARLDRWSQVPAKMSVREAVGESEEAVDGQVSLFGGAT